MKSDFTSHKETSNKSFIAFSDLQIFGITCSSTTNQWKSRKAEWMKGERCFEWYFKHKVFMVWAETDKDCIFMIMSQRSSQFQQIPLNMSWQLMRLECEFNAIPARKWIAILYSFIRHFIDESKIVFIENTKRLQ